MAFEKFNCPYCGQETEADWVDVDVGFIQCGPYFCTNCGASQIGLYDNTESVSKEELRIGWYKPHSPMGSSVNTYNGKYVKHDEALELYKLGLLDEKK